MTSNSRPIYITTPIYYVNDKPHVGHAYTTIVGDFLTRAFKLLGREAYFLTGTDEHGAKVAEVARANGMTPQQWCDTHSQYFKDAWKRLDIDNNYFVRTTDARHVLGVRKMLERLQAKKDDQGRQLVYEKEYIGLYCLGCEKFITEKELVDGLCPEHLTKPQELREKNYFFRLTSYLDQVREKIEKDEIRILPHERKNEVLGLLRQDVLEDFSISREKVDWGIPLPWDPSQNAYVWVDALPNYITAVGYGDDAKQFDHRWKGSQVLHLMAKDILKFHAIYWPAILLAIGEKPPESLFIHGYFTVNGQKMSKTLRNALDPHVMVDQFGPDGTRYLLLTQFQFGQDGDLKADEFIRQYNADLANDFGNLVSRTITLVSKHCGGILPKGVQLHGSCAELTESDKVFANNCDTQLLFFQNYLDAEQGSNWKIPFDVNGAIDAGMGIVRLANQYFANNRPWELATKGELDRLVSVLSATVEAIRRAAILLYPVIPVKAAEVLTALGVKDVGSELSLEGLGYESLNPRPSCVGPFRLDAPIFPRLDKAEVKATEKKPVNESPVVAENVVTIDQFRQTKLRIAEVLAAEKVEGADKLLKLQVAVGDERRQIVAGIALHYKPEELVGKTIVIVANLLPSKIRGVESQGMLLAASSGATLKLLTTDGVIESGSSVG